MIVTEILYFVYSDLNLRIHVFFWLPSLSVVMSEVEETIKRIQSHKGVIGIIVVSQDGKYILLKTISVVDRGLLSQPLRFLID